jgi:hypothetical protein
MLKQIQTQKILQACEPGTTLVGQYINSKTTIDLLCSHGHTRSIIPSNLLTRGNGTKCPICNNVKSSKRKTTDEFLKEIQELGFTGRLKSEYVNAHTPIELEYGCGHVERHRPTNILTRPSELECSICNYKGPKPLTIEEVNQQIKTLFPYLTVVDFEKTVLPYTVLDSRCGHTSTVHHANIAHKGVYRCQVCYPKGSNQQRELLDFIKSNYTGWIVENDRTILEGKELDIVLPDLGIAIEYNGGYWHSEERVGINYHLDKTEAVESFGYQLVHIDEYDWVNSRDIVKSRLYSILGLTQHKIYARNCTIEKIKFPREFLNTNHIQGAGAPTSINYALKAGDKIVAVMTFGHTRFDNKYNYEYELYRFCSKINTTVVGGASKLFKQFHKDYPNASVMTYADRSYSTGNLYKKLGFAQIDKTGPSYSYFSSNGYKLSRYQCQKDKLADLFPAYYNDKLSEQEIMKRAGYYKVFNSGNLIYGFRNLLPRLG